MSGRFEFNVGENGEPFYDINLGGTVTRLTWENATLFTHAEQHDHVDHVFVDSDTINEETGAALGAFIFRFALVDFDDLAGEMMDYDYPHIHMPEPSDVDISTYRRSKPEQDERAAPKNVNVIVEDNDAIVVAEAMSQLDAELAYFLGE